MATDVARRDSHVYVDMKTLNEARSDSATLWIKQTRGTEGDDKPHSVEQYELNCGSRQIRRLSAASYDASGNVIGSHEGGDWATVVPDSLGETLLDGMCGSK